jgi:hypothetical protein
MAVVVQPHYAPLHPADERLVWLPQRDSRSGEPKVDQDVNPLSLVGVDLERVRMRVALREPPENHVEAASASAARMVGAWGATAG